MAAVFPCCFYLFAGKVPDATFPSPSIYANSANKHKGTVSRDLRLVFICLQGRDRVELFPAPPYTPTQQTNIRGLSHEILNLFLLAATRGDNGWHFSQPSIYFSSGFKHKGTVSRDSKPLLLAATRGGNGWSFSQSSIYVKSANKNKGTVSRYFKPPFWLLLEATTGGSFPSPL